MALKRMILQGGGGPEDSRFLDEQFARWTEAGGRMLYIPIAAGLADYAPYEAFIRGVYEPLGVHDIEVWTSFPADAGMDLASFSSIYIGGGNTFSLLHLMRTSGFDRHLVDFIDRGGAVCGGSAGAIVLGWEIMTCAHLDPNDIGLDDTRGLNAVHGYAVWCHYTPDDDLRIREFISKYGLPVLALTERGGICVEGDHIRASGYDPALHFANGRKQVIGIGDIVPELPTP